MIYKRISRSGRSCSGTADYILGRDPEHVAKAEAGERIGATGFSCPGRPEVRDVDDAKAWLARESEDYRMQGGQGRPYLHGIISFEKGEQPTPLQLAEAVEVFRRRMGMPPEAPLLWGLHTDTKNTHLHIQASTVIADERGRLAIRSLNTEDHHGVATTKNGRAGRVCFHDAKAAHRACAEICRVQGWSPKNLAWNEAGQRVTKYTPADGVRLSPRVADYEATHGKMHASHQIGLTALPILAAATSRAEAVEKLAAAGIVLEIKPTKGGRDGGVLSAPLGGRLKLSALPRGCGLAALDARAAAAAAMGQPQAQAATPSGHGRPAAQATPASPLRVSAAGAVKLAQARRTPAPWTAARVKNQARRILSSAAGWDDILRDFQREGWTLARAGKTGALIVAPGASETDPKIRVKMSDIGRGTSYGKVSEKLGFSVEEAVENGDLKPELFAAVIEYPETAQKSAISAAQNSAEIPTDPNAIVLPQNVLDDEALTGQPSALRKLGEVARDTIRESLKQDKSIVQTIERLAEKGIKIELFEKEGVGLVSLRLSAVGIKGSLALSSLPADCRLKALAAKFNEKYRQTPDKRHFNPEAAKAAELVEIDPEDDLIEIIRKNLAKIASQNAHGTKIFDFSRDTRKLKKVEQQAANESAALDIAAPVDLSKSEKEVWKASELIKREFKSAISAYNKKVEEGVENVDMWKILIPALEKRGWSLEMTETGAQVRIDKRNTIDLADLELNFIAYCRIFGEPEIPMVKDGLSKEELQELKEQVQFDRFAKFSAMDVRDIFKLGDFDAIMNEIEARGWRIEAAGNSAQVVINEHLTVPLWRTGVDYEDLCERWGREPDFQIAGWREMNQEQQRFEMQKKHLRQIFRAKSWEGVIQRLELQGARLELTKDGNGGRVVLKDGSKVKISEFTRSLKSLREKKAGDLSRLVAVREAARKTEKAIEAQKARDTIAYEQKQRQRQEQPLKPSTIELPVELRNILTETKETKESKLTDAEREDQKARRSRFSSFGSNTSSKTSTDTRSDDNVKSRTSVNRS